MMMKLLLASLLGMQLVLAAPPKETRPWFGQPGTADEPVPALFGAMPELFDGANPELFGNPELISEREDEDDDEDHEDSWKWAPHFPCSIEGNNGTVYEKECPMDLQCNMGPLSIMRMNESFTIKYCALPGKFFLYHACSVMKEGKVIKENDMCAKLGGRCNVGPLRIETDGDAVQAKFCNLLAWKPSEEDMKMTKEQKITAYACRVEDVMGNDLFQNTCPKGFRCTKGPKAASYEDKHYVAHLCEEIPEPMTLGQIVKKALDMGAPPQLILAVLNKMKDMEEIEPMQVLEAVKMHAMLMGIKLREHSPQDEMKELLKKVMEVLMGHRASANAEKAEMLMKIANMVMQKRGGHDQEAGAVLNTLKEILEGKRQATEQEKGQIMMKLKEMIEGKMEDKKESIQDIMHMLHHKHMWEMESKARESMGGEGGNLKELMQRLGGMGMEHDQEEKGDRIQELLKMFMTKNHAGEKKDDILDFMKQVMMMKQAMEQAKPKDNMDDLKKLVVLLTMMGQEAPREKDGDLMKMVMEMFKQKMGSNDFDTDMIKKLLGGGKDDEDDDEPKKNFLIMKKVLESLMGKMDAGATEEDKKIYMVLVKARNEGSSEAGMLLEKFRESLLSKKFPGQPEKVEFVMKLSKMFAKKKGDDKEPADFLKKLMGGMKDDDREAGDFLKKLMGKDDEDEREAGDMLKKLMEVLMGRRQSGENEKGEMLMKLAKFMMGHGEDREAGQLLMKLKDMLGGRMMADEREKGDLLKKLMGLLGGKMGGDREMGEKAMELMGLVQKVHDMFAKAGMMERDVPKPIRMMMEYIMKSNMADIVKQMMAKKMNKPESGDLYKLLSAMEKMFEGVDEKDIPEPLMDMIHMLHHEHLWNMEQNMRMNMQW